MKKFICLLTTLLMIPAVLSGCTSGKEASSGQAAPAQSQTAQSAPADKEEAKEPSGSADSEVYFKIGHVLNTESPFHAGALEFARLIEEKSGGTMTAEVFPSALLGNDRELAEGLQLGTVDMAVTATAPVSGFAPKIQIFDLPYLFKNAKHAYAVLDGEIGSELLDDFYQNSGIVALAFWENGFRNITNSTKPILSAGDVKGLKIRTQEISCHLDYWKSLGADPTPMAWTEVYTALQQGTVDGQENPVQTIYTQKVYEVQKYMSMTNHVYAPTLIMMSESKWDTLSDEQKAIAKEAALEAATYERQFIADLEGGAVKELPGLGCEVTPADQIDLESFMNAAQPVIDQYGAELGASDIIAKIQDMAGQF